MQAQPYCAYFLFINSSSGGGVGAKLIEQEKAQKISFELSLDQKELQQKKNIDVYFYNMKKNRDKGFDKLKSLVIKNIRTKAIICGGDGTVIWVVNQLSKNNIDTQKVPLGVIPLGTGNDFSQYFGWGKLKTTLTQNSFSSLKKLIRKWQKAKVQDFDIWDVQAEVFEYGKFQKVEDLKNKLIQGKKFQRSFCNYFSFGIDGKIGYSFDLHRTTSRLGNLAMYGMMGMIKAMTKTKTVNELIYGMQIRPQLSSQRIIPEQTFNQPISNIKQEKQKRISFSSPLIPSNNINENKQIPPSKFIFKTKSESQVQQALRLKNDYYSIAALNINSFMGGVFDIWQNAKNALNNQDSKNFQQMNSGDGKLQFITFSSSIGMAAERSIGGFAEKVTQGQGPFYFKFKQYDDNLKHRTYLQIDGEFIRFTHPKSVLIRKSIYGKNGKIKVLRNVQIK